MCVNQRRIKTRYMKRPIYVNCGNCPACLQHKAAKRVYRINNHKSDDKVCFMVALTYSRGTSPYIDRTEAYEFAHGERMELNVYRDCQIRKVRKPRDWNQYNQVYKKTNKRVILDKIDFIENMPFNGLKDMKFEHGKISVNYYKDYQGFLARYRLNLKRHYNYDKPVSCFACSEYGCESDRSHFHLLLYGDRSDKEILRAAIYESWPFSDLCRFPRAVEEAFKSASYCASYVNQRNGFPHFLKKYFTPRHSYSKGFGVSSERFSISNVLRSFDKGSLSFSVLKMRYGYNYTATIPYPKYLINRYFPQFKGCNAFTPCQIYEDFRRIDELDFTEKDVLRHTYESGLKNDDVFIHLDNSDYTFDELLAIRTRLRNAFQRLKDSPLPDNYQYLKNASFLDYAKLYQKVWINYKSTILRLHMENMDLPLLEKYDNLDEVLVKKIPTVGFELSDIKETDPNKFVSTILDTQIYAQAYRDNFKHRKISNQIYHSQQVDCEL